MLRLYGAGARADARHLERREYDVCLLRLYELAEIGGLDTSRITSASEMFHGCKNLRKIGGRLDFSKVTSKIDTTFVSDPHSKR